MGEFLLKKQKRALTLLMREIFKMHDCEEKSDGVTARAFHDQNK